MCLPAEKCYVIINRPPPPEKAVADPCPRHALVRAAVGLGPAGRQGPGPVTVSSTGPAPGPQAGPSAADAAAVAAQLGREPRGLLAVAHRCPCGLPDVIETAPRLPDGTPFPTLYYLTCPRAVAAVSRLEAGGLMREMSQQTAADPGLRQAYQAAHRDYLARRDEAARASGVEPLPAGHAQRGRHAGPGEVPARAGRARARGTGDEPAGSRGGPGRRGVVAGGPVHRPARGPPGRAAMSGPGTVRVAAVDCGTNSLRLLIADVDREAAPAHRRRPADGDRPAGPGSGCDRPPRAGAAGAGAARAPGVRARDR